MTAATQIAEFSHALDPSRVPATVIERTKLHVMDAIGCALAADALALGGAGRAAMADLGAGDATAIGLSAGLPAPNAALANAMLVHALDYDDTHSGAVCHISAVVVPAALAVAETTRSSGSDLLAAIVAGTEAVARIGGAASGRFHARGFHPTAACGVFGAAIAASRLARLNAETTTAALGIAGSMSSGLLAYLNEGVQTKPIHAGWAAHAGVLASRLADNGAEGPPDVLEGRFGLFDAFVGPPEADVETQVSDLGERWETLNISCKAYPACHFMHGSLAATASLLDRVRANEIDEIEVTVPEEVVAIICEPTAEKVRPRSDYDAKFSIQYSTAAMLLNGMVNLETYTADAREDRGVQDLARKVKYGAKPYSSTDTAFPGGVRIRMVDGSVLESDCPYQPGAPENPMSEAQMRAKFRANAALSRDSDSVDALEEGISSLELQADLGWLSSLLRPVAVAA
jgi:2-methylcitrate dehydratase PrpD